MDFSNPYDFENEFQFQLYKDIRRSRMPSTWKVTQPCDLNHMATDRPSDTASPRRKDNIDLARLLLTQAARRCLVVAGGLFAAGACLGSGGTFKLC